MSDVAEVISSDIEAEESKPVTNDDILIPKDLLAKDSNGFSDPYVLIPKDQPGILGIPKKGLKTHKKKKTLNPVWNQSFQLQCNIKQCNILKFEVYDYDFIGSDDFLGNGEIHLEWMANPKLKFYEDWINLYRIKKNKKQKKWKHYIMDKFIFL